MKRTLLLLTCMSVVMTLAGCQSCKKMFGLDRRCEQPPPSYYQQPPNYSGPINYAPAPGSCNAPTK